jgi:hypothetical protein
MRRRPGVMSWPAVENGRNGKRARFPETRRAGQGGQVRLGRQIECDLDDLQPEPVLRGVVRGKVPQACRTRGPDAVLRAGPEPVTELEFGDRPAGGVGGEAGEPNAVRVCDPQLGPGMRPFLADAQPHPVRPSLKDITS